MAPRPLLYAVVLAAGAGRRFGGRKLLHPLQGRPLLHHALETAFAAPIAGVILVVGCDGADVTGAAEAFAQERPTPPLRVVTAEDWAEGLAASLRAGVRGLPAEAEGAYVFLGDMPWVPRSVLQPLADALAAGAAAAVPVFEGRAGHPVLMSARLFTAVQELSGDRGARRLLDGLGSNLAVCQTDNPGVLRDIDRPQDLP